MASILGDLLVKLKLNNSQYNKELKESGKKTSMFGDGVKKIGGLIAGAFAVQQVVAFGKELLELGGIAEGVRSAFVRIGGMEVLEDLKDATKDTVSELELMKRAVSAQNLGLPIEKLASLFEFATKRAQETGESVDFLVNSIVTGIGRKSPLILDNLGISAIQLREKLKGVGMETASVADVAAAVGEIAADSMRESGGIIETNAVKMDQLSTAWKNWKLEISESQGFLKLVSNILNDIMLTGSIITSDQLSGWEKIKSLLFDSKEEAQELARALDEAKTNAEQMGPFIEDILKPFEDFKEPEFFSDDMIEEMRENWEKSNNEFQESINLINAIDDAILSLNKSLKDTNILWNFAGGDPSAAKETGGVASMVSDMLGDEEGEDLGFDTAAFAQKLEETQAFVDELNNIMEQGMEQFIGTVAEGLGQAIATGDWEAFGNAILSTIGSFFKQMGAALIAYGLAMDAFKKAFTNPFLAIAAGTALVAIGGYIGGLGSGGPQGFSGGGGGASVGATAFNVVNTNAQDQELVTRVSGRDLDFVLTKYKSDRRRR